MRQKIFSVYLGMITFLMFAAILACQRLYKYDNLVWDTRNLCAVLIAPALGGIAAAVFAYSLLGREKEDKISQLKEQQFSAVKMFFLSLASMIILWLPGFFAYYPGICAFDFQPQIYQIFYNAYNNHHPLLHTLLIAFFWKMGMNLFHSATIGIAIFSLLQIALMAAVFSLVVVSLAKHFKSRRLGIVLAVLFACYPFHFYLSISITKDIPFALGMLLAVTSIFLLLSCSENNFKPQKWDFMLFVSVLMVMLFRNNGKYGVIVLIGVSVLVLPFIKGMRRLALRILTESLAAFVIGMVCLGALDSATNATGGDKREMLSLPGQQIARVVHYHAGELSDEMIANIETVIWPSALYCYRPDIADPVKKDIISYEVLHYPKKYAQLYMELFKKYPDEYVNAFLALYAGFLDPFDVSCNYINDDGNGVPEGLYYIQTVFYEEDMKKFDIEQKPRLPRLYEGMEAFANSTAFRKIPVLNMIMVPGVFLWAYLYLLGFSIYRHGMRQILPFALLAGYFLTLFAGPTVQLRYLYPVMVCLPVAVVFVFKKNRGTV